MARVRALEAQVERHVRARGEAVERDAALRQELARVSHDLDEAREALATARRADAPAGDVVPAADLEAVKAEAAALRQEYMTYRRRTMSYMNDKDEQVKRLTAELQQLKGKARPPAVVTSDVADAVMSHHAAGTPAAAVRSTSAASTPSAESARAAPAHDATASGGMDAARVAYLRQVITRYLSTHDVSVRAALEPALMTVAGLTPLEIAGVMRSRSAASNAPLSLTGAPAPADGVVASLWSTASSLLGMASSPAPPAVGMSPVSMAGAHEPPRSENYGVGQATPASARDAARPLAFTPSHGAVP